jgi:hypothetical protein
VGALQRINSPIVRHSKPLRRGPQNGHFASIKARERKDNVSSSYMKKKEENPCFPLKDSPRRKDKKSSVPHTVHAEEDPWIRNDRASFFLLNSRIRNGKKTSRVITGNADR